MHYIINTNRQQIIGAFGDEFRSLELPDPDEYLMPGVQWGRHEHALTPAFWVSQAWMTGEPNSDEFRLGGSLAEEVTACLLGGHGSTAEIGLAAFTRVRDELKRENAQVLSQAVLEKLLLEPLMVNGRSVRYRFARQRARYLAGSLEGLANINEGLLSDTQLREALCNLPGIGPKTASWVVRNRRSSDKVAILDVHIIRACRLMRVFPENASPAKNYRNLESSFLDFCRITGARASVLDAVMWGTMRKLSSRMLHFLIDSDIALTEPLTPFSGGNSNVRVQRSKG